MRSSLKHRHRLALTALVVLYSPSAFAQTYDLPDRVKERVDGIERDFEQAIRDKLPDFSLVRDDDDAARMHDTANMQAFMVTIDDAQQAQLQRAGSPPLIVTAHDRRTGVALDSCEVPCRLRSPKMPPALLVFYRYGTAPDYRGAEYYLYFDDPQPHFLRFNEVDHHVHRRECREQSDLDAQVEPDKDATPCVRVPPEIPDEAELSGHCDMSFDLSDQGDPINIVAESCTQQIYCEPSLEAVQRWIYLPKRVRGGAVQRGGMTTRVFYRMNDRKGNLTPTPTGDPVPCIGSV